MVSLGKQSATTSVSSHGSLGPRDPQVDGHYSSVPASPETANNDSNRNSNSRSRSNSKQTNHSLHPHLFHPSLPHHHSRHGNDDPPLRRSSPVLQQYPDQQRRRRLLQQLELDAYPEPPRSKHRRKSHHKSREGHLPRTHLPKTKKQLAIPNGTMNLIPTRSSEREKEKEREGVHGLLKPQLTQTSTAGSEARSEGTGAYTGSRKGSLAGGGFRKASVTLEDMETEKVKRKEGEEHLRYSLSSIATLSTEITRRLDYTYYNLLEKLASLQSTVTSFQELSDLASRLEADFENEKAQVERDSRKQIDELKGTDAYLERIEALEARMTAGREKVEKLETRLQVVREKIDGWERREGEWQARVSRRLRILWAVMGTLFMIFLAASIARRWPSTNPPGTETSARVETFTNESLEALDVDKVDLPHPKAGDQEQKVAIDLQDSNVEEKTSKADPAVTKANGEGPEAFPEAEESLVRVIDEL